MSKDWINLGALAVVGVTALASLGALLAGAEMTAVMAVSGPVYAGCFTAINRSGVQ